MFVQSGNGLTLLTEYFLFNKLCDCLLLENNEKKGPESIFISRKFVPFLELEIQEV